MATFDLSTDSIKTLKARLGSVLPTVASSHLYEAIANALGFNTYAALKSKQCASNVKLYDFDQGLFTQRLITLGYSSMFESYTKSEPRIKLNKSAQIWHKLMVYGLNEAIIQGMFDLKIKNLKHDEYSLFEFKLDNGIKVNAGARDAGFEEIALAIAINPRDMSYCTANPSLKQNDAYAKGWLERKEGFWLQVSDYGQPVFESKRETLQMLKELKSCLPLGYNQFGKFMN